MGSLFVFLRGRGLFKLRESRGLSQGQVAYKMRHAGYDGFTQRTVQKLERGDRRLHLDEGLELARILDIPPARLVCDEPCEQCVIPAGQVVPCPQLKLLEEDCD